MDNVIVDPAESITMSTGNASAAQNGLVYNASAGTYKLKCEDQLFIPVWYPQDVTEGVIAYRGIVYLVCMSYVFLGVSIVADKFMASIQMITSIKKEIQVQDERGERKTVVVRVWNETVANLTLMACGCSAPEILLGIVEVIGKGFEADELGPGVAVGGAAINLFVVLGLCNLMIPRNEVRRIKRVSVFLVDAVWCLFSFFWLFLIVKVISPGVVEVWEALVTFLLFPVTVLSAYLADRHVAIYDYLSKTYGMGRHGVIVEMTTDEQDVVESNFNFKQFDEEKADEEVRDFEDHRRAFLLSMKNLRRRCSVESPNHLELLAAEELFKRGTQSKAFYRRLSTMMLSGLTARINGTLSRRRSELNLQSLYEVHMEEIPYTLTRRDPNVSKIFFRPGHFTVMENVGEFTANVVREDGDLNQQVLVDYATEDGGALARRDYVPLRSTLVFEPGESSKTITVRIIEDNIYEGDQLFYIRLFNIRVNKYDERRFTRGDIAEDAYRMTSMMSAANESNLSTISENEERSPTVDRNLLFPPPIEESHRESFYIGEDIEMEELSEDSGLPSIAVIDVDDVHSCRTPTTVQSSSSNKACLVCPSLATVMILDDDHHGIFSLTDRTVTVTESVGTYNIRIVRCGGSRGRVVVPFRTEEGTAQPQRDYQHCDGDLIFEDGEIEKIVSVIITVNVSYQKDVFFYFTLGKPLHIRCEGEPDLDRDLEELNSRNLITNRQRISMQGRPQLGEISTTIIRLQENKAFQSSVDKMLKRANMKLRKGYSAWIQQFVDLFSINLSDDEGNVDEERTPGRLDYIMHILYLPWNLFVAFIPPESLMGGYPCFVLSVFALGVQASFLGDFASLLGCTVGLQDSVTAVGIVAFGTTVPDMLVSRFAAIKDKHADASINNVFGAKSLNVYFGIGLAWSAAAIYHTMNGNKFYVEPGNLAFGVSVYVGLGVLAIIVLLLRRIPANEGELGGSLKYRLPMTLLFLASWLAYVILYSLQVYGHIDGF